MTKRTSDIQIPFLHSRTLRARFDEAPISSDGGAVLLEALDRRLRLTEGVAAAIPDARDPRYVVHTVLDQVRQRVFGIALGYEDCNDARALRDDPLLKICCGREPEEGALASQPTLSRFENEATAQSCYRLARALLESYFARHPHRPARRLVLDLDTTCDPTHGQQEFGFFNAFYDEHCFLPLLVFDQDGDLFTALLQPGKPQGGRTAVAVLKRLIRRLRQQWPGIRILVRADSGFASPEMYRLCRALKVNFLIGFQPNVKLNRLSKPLQEKARRKFLRTGRKARLFSSLRYRAKKGWDRSWRVLIKAEHMKEGANTRYVITDLSGPAAALYDDIYVQRAEACENSIKDLKNALKADRLSCHRFLANQFRLLLHSTAYVLLFALRRLAHGTELAAVQMDTLRLRLLKIACRVEQTARHVWLHFTSAYPWQPLWRLIAERCANLAFG
jgi:Transposase DDE domain group 1